MIGAALAGIRVLDFAQVGAGPTCGMLLGDLGAEVVKIEPPGGEIGRKLGPPWQNGESVVSMSFNRNKRSLAIDLKRPGAIDLVRRLVKQADVVLESFRPGVMDKLGLGYAALSAEQPKLIMCSVSAYGQGSPWRDKPGVDGIVQAVSGLMSNIGLDGQPPCKVQVPAVDVTTGFLAALAILAALRTRDILERGQHLDVSMYAAALMLQQSAVASFLSSGEIPAKLGSGAPYSTPNEAYPTRDGWIMVAAYHEERWRALCAVLECPELATQPEFSTNEQRIAHRAALTEALSARFGTRSTAEWVEALEARDIICGPIAEYPEVVSTTQFAASGVAVEMEHTTAGTVRMPGFAIGDGDAQGKVRYPPPLAGEHSAELLVEFGLAKMEIAALLAGRIVFQHPGAGPNEGRS
jgi:crotonobetainyl-CoA:carnitine CoA-transferase CaiB-like acyl-CoA transferase